MLKKKDRQLADRESKIIRLTQENETLKKLQAEVHIQV